MWTRIRELRKELPARWLLDLGHTALSLLLVAGITGLIGIALHFYKIDHVTILYLIPVLVAALHWGLVPAVVAAIAGVAAPAFFFYPPIYDLRVHNPDQVIDCVVHHRRRGNEPARRDCAPG